MIEKANDKVRDDFKSAMENLDKKINKMREAVKDESLGLISVSRLNVPNLSVSSQSRTKFWNLSCLGLVSYKNFGTVSSRSRLVGLVFT